ncbi:MAG: polysaccharide biosynthesis/export family protein [Verrucomicrobia bacterium]|nr:polysaccharide biosynthesis/export family protein [Verrucomicrobiota bacterium]
MRSFFRAFVKWQIFLLLFVAACTNPPYRGPDVVGAEEFVMDSYRIREGKFSILQMEGKESEELSSSMLDEYKDVINEGDVLKIALYHPTRGDLVTAVRSIGDTVGFRVSEGKVYLPDLAPVPVEGLTLQEAQEKIQALYREEIRDVDLFIAYKDRVVRKVELAGLVQVPSIPVDGRLRLFEALSIAKVPPNANLFKSYVVRDNCLLPVDMTKLMKEGDMEHNVVMRGGDKVYIAEPSASTLMVLGEVGKERVVDLPDGYMTLRKALAEAGGILSSGDRSYIQVIRGNIAHPKIYTLHWEHVVRLPNDSMLLIPGDIVYVAARPLSEWNRFVNDLLPTFIALDLVTKGIKGVGVNVP